MGDDDGYTFTCPNCGMEFWEELDLIQHMEHRHENHPVIKKQEKTRKKNSPPIKKKHRQKKRKYHLPPIRSCPLDKTPPREIAKRHAAELYEDYVLYEMKFKAKRQAPNRTFR